MGYRLAVDMGTTFTAAAAVETGHENPSMHELGNRAVQIPSVLYLQEDGQFLVGEAAERRGATDPSRVVREFKRRIGDRVPLLIAGTPFTAQVLSARLLSWVVASATERLGAPPDEVVLTYPAGWGVHKRRLVDEVIALADVGATLTCPEPVAAAIHYSTESHLEPGSRVAVYDLGGGTFDVCVVEKTESGFTILGTPDGVEQLGGVDFDEKVFQHVFEALGPFVDELDLDSPEGVAALTRLRRECVEAKESLSTDVVTVIPVALPGRSTSVRLTRAEFETLIAPDLDRTLEATARALHASGTTAEQLTAIVLVGGSSRIPLVSQLLQARFLIQPAVNTHPKYDVALGAAEYQVAPARPIGAEQPAASLPVAWPMEIDEADQVADSVSRGGRIARLRPLEWVAGLSERTRRLSAVAAAAIAVAVVTVVAVLFATQDGASTATDPRDTASPTPAPTSSVPLPAGAALFGMAISPDGQRVYVSHQRSNLVSVVDVRTKAVVGQIKVGRQPLGVAVSDRDGHIYAVNSGSGTVTKIDEATLAPMGSPIGVGTQPQSIVTRPGRSIAYVTNVGDDTVSVVDLENEKVIKTIRVGDRPLNLAIGASGRRVYVANAGSATVSVINTATNQISGTIPVRAKPHDIAVSSETQRLYLTHNGSNVISVIDTTNWEPTGVQIKLAAEPFDLVLSGRGQRLYATLNKSGLIAVVDTRTTPRVGVPIPVGDEPAGIAISEDGERLYVTNNDSGTVSVINTADNEPVGQPIEVSPSPSDAPQTDPPPTRRKTAPPPATRRTSAPHTSPETTTEPPPDTPTSPSPTPTPSRAITPTFTPPITIG
ncbi:Hsp70 family protein [Kribbella qitaiheensis]|uniref:Hsp70 family protein n=1 Tax=Kribbella qitaiheensis TaxID=1544730 RepID=UPI0036130A42